MSSLDLFDKFGPFKKIHNSDIETLTHALLFKYVLKILKGRKICCVLQKFVGKNLKRYA
jgi:hypothetical protein